jgi:prolipoprotein diacylglyceryltransferase
MFPSIPLGPIVLSSGLLFLLFAFLLSLELFLRLADSAGLSVSMISKSWWIFLLASIVGGRLAAIINHYRVYVADLPRIVMFSDGNFSFLGAWLGIGFVLYLLTRARGTAYLPWLDALTPAAVLGLAVNDVGHFLAATHYGRPTNMPWGVTLEGVGVRYAVPIHPVQLYESFFFFVLLLLLLTVRQRKPRAGAETLIGIFFAGTLTFVMEYFRGDFSLLVFVRWTDVLLLAMLFLSLGVLATVEQRWKHQWKISYAAILVLLTLTYVVLRPLINGTEFEWRLAQFLSILAMLATFVYVVYQRWRNPHL